MKAVFLAGGNGSRLYPLTSAASKQLLPVYDKPMFYYPLTTLIENGIREFCLISTPQDLPRFRQLLRNGNAWGISGATICGYQVQDPQRYGVVKFDSQGRAISLEEKPQNPKSSYAVPGPYLYDAQVASIAKTLCPSARGELEITDIHRAYLEKGQLRVCPLSRGFAWIDAETSSSLHDAAAYMQTIERRQGIKIDCPEKAAFGRGFLSLEQFEALAANMSDCEYRDYLVACAAEARTLNARKR